MGERKRQQIRRLQAEVDQYRQRDAELEPYLKIGEELHGRVARRVAEMDEDDLEKALIEEVSGAEERLVREGIWARLNQLPVETVLGWYAIAIGDEQVNDLLQQRAEIEKAFLRNNMHIEVMRQQGLTYHNIDTSMTQSNDHMVVGFNTTRWQPRPDSMSLRRLDQQNKAGVLFEVLQPPYERLDSRYWLRSHQVVAIGGARLPKSKTLDSVVTLNTPLAVWEFDDDGYREDDPSQTGASISFIAVNNIVVLGERPEVS